MLQEARAARVRLSLSLFLTHSRSLARSLSRSCSRLRALSRSLLREFEQVRDKEERKLRKELAVAAAEERAVREAEERRDLLVQLEAEVLVEVETQRRAAEESLRQAKELQARRERIAEQRRQQQQAEAAADPAPRDLRFVERLRSALGADFVKFQRSFRMPVDGGAVGEVQKDDVALALRELPFTPQVACVVGLRSCVFSQRSGLGGRLCVCVFVCVCV